MTAPPLGFVRISSADPPLNVVARLWEERPNVEQGYGGWEEVTRPRRAPITTWKSQPGLHLVLPVLLDRHREGRSIEAQVTRIERMARPTAADGEPPQIRIEARGGHVPWQNRTWVIADLAWGDALMNADGNRTRQQVTLSLLEYVEDVYLQQRSAANRRRKKAQAARRRRGASSKRVVVKKSTKKKRARAYTLTDAPRARLSTYEESYGTGEDLASIAARELGDARRWIEIAKLNGLRDPQAVPAGMVLRLP